MSADSLRASAEVLAFYRAAFQTHGRREEALNWSKHKQTERFAALCRGVEDGPATLLDYGCGFGDLALWLHHHRPSIVYTGADALAEFIASNREHLPQTRFLTVGSPAELDAPFDHVVCCGVFNIDTGADQHWNYVQEMLAGLFAKTRVALHVDFLAHDVDWRQDRAYHQDIAALVQFVETRLSRRYTLDRSYMPYEYCISIFADRAVAPERNVYAHHR